MTGRVEYGSEEVEKIKRHRPFIKIDAGQPSEVEFIANVTFDDINKCREFCEQVYLILSGKQNNIKYSKDGDA